MGGSETLRTVNVENDNFENENEKTENKTVLEDVG
jgi:hypothetical protein